MLVTNKDLLVPARRKGYAVGAFNINNLETVLAVAEAATEEKSPAIIAVTPSAIKYAGLPYLSKIVKTGAESSSVPMSLHLDHGDTFELCKSCIESGFSSVMIDGSSKSYEDNIKLTRQVVEYARQYDVTVEGELGVLAGIEDEVQSEHSHYTDPAQVEDFVKRTGVDSLAISIGTSHGAFKFKVKPGEEVPPLRFDILEECERRIPGFPIVLHGASSVLTDYIDMINKFGGKMENAVGVPAGQLRKAAKSAVCKINIDSDGRLVMTAVIRKVFAEKPGEFDPRKYLGPAREELIRMYADKNQNVLGSAGRV